MNDETLDQFEQRLMSASRRPAPDDLRASVLGEASRELRAARWDRRLARTTALLLVVGVSLNAAIGLQGLGLQHSTQPQVSESAARQSLIETAVVIAEATDPATGSRFARHIAAMSGRELTADEAAAIEAAVHHADSPASTNGNKG